MFGQANGFYEYAAQLDGSKSADDLAFLRNEREFLNHQVVEIENGHFGKTIVRNFLYDVFKFLFFTKLSNSKDETLAALSCKIIKRSKIPFTPFYKLAHSIRRWNRRI